MGLKQLLAFAVQPIDPTGLLPAEDIAPAVVDMFNRVEGPGQIALAGDLRQMNPACQIGKDKDVVAISNIWYLFLVGRDGTVNNALC